MDSNNVEIVVVGSCNMDLIVYAPRLPLPGETIHGSRFVTGFGGKGANQCVAAAKLGAVTSMVAKVGNDSHGVEFIKNFKRVGVNIDFVSQTSESSTGVAPITVGENGKNSIVIVSGANMLLSSSDIDKAENLIKSAKVMLCQLEISMPTTLHALKLAKSHGLTTVFNPAPAPNNDLDPEFYHLCDVMCPNETEAFILTGVNVVDVESAKSASLELVNKGCRIGIITLGEMGCVFVEKSDLKPIFVEANKVKPVDTTGAGDCFAGALAFFLAKHQDLPLCEQVKRANYVASVSVRHEGTQSSYPLGKDLPSFLFQ